MTANNVPSAVMGNNSNSQWFGARDGFGPGNHFDILLSSAGGGNKIAGDYLYKSFPVGELTAGVWGVFRVNGTPQQQTACASAARQPKAMFRVGPEATQPPAPRPALIDPQERFLNRRLRKTEAPQGQPSQKPPQ